MKSTLLSSRTLAKETVTRFKCFVFLGIDSKTVDMFLEMNKTKPFGIVLKIDSSFPGENGNPASLLDIETFVNVISCLTPEDELVLIEDDEDKTLSFLFLLGTLVHRQEPIENAMYECVKKMPNAVPKAVWVAMCLDECLGARGALIKAYDEYLVTKIVVNKQGQLIEAKF